MWIDDVYALGGAQVHLRARHATDLGDPGSRGVDDDSGPSFGRHPVRPVISNADHRAAIAQQTHHPRVIQSARAVRDGVLNVGEDETMRIDAPLLHRHRADHVA